MRTISKTQHICEHCGVDFTNRDYAERIGHQNATSSHNVDVTAYRFNHAKTKQDSFKEMKDVCDVDIKDGNYDCSMEIAKCLIKQFRSGVPHYDGKNFNDVKHPKIADFIEANLHKIKEWYIEEYEKKCSNIMANYRAKIDYYKSHIEELKQK